MTEKLPPLSTPIAPPSQSAAASLLPSVVAARDTARKQELAVEEEPYTIKCICNFTDDDGNTIYCETCETWQHIECYYPDNIDDALRADFAHSCVDCEPRPIDRQQAIERQSARLAGALLEEAAADKKAKRPPSKSSNKKRPKPSELQINGGAHHSHGADISKHTGSHDNPPPAKKAKSSHRPSHSVSSTTAKRSPSYGNAKAAATHGHPLSPVTTPPDLPDDFELHAYSPTFTALYTESDAQLVFSNSFTHLQVSNTMSAWLRDPLKLQKETGCSYSDVFQDIPLNIDLIAVKPVVERVKKTISPDKVVQWQCLIAPRPIDKDVPLVEVNGQIGFQAAYCAEPSSKWDELTSPLPFVLFHPLLPLYIDTRKEGSEARYVRRSCKPNAILETYLSTGSEYHFWLVSDRKIAAKEQITIPWDFRLPNDRKARIMRVLGLEDDDDGAHTETVDDEEYQTLAAWVYRVLTEYGGCACNLGPECAFARFHRNHLAKIKPRSNPGPTLKTTKKQRKTKASNAHSPTSIGHATNSRAPSEGRLEDGTELDHRSVSSSSRSKPPSRDLTPTARHGSFDTLGILTEPTDRDKRKVAMVEDTFRRMEQQQQQQSQRKRKRASDGHNAAKASKTSSTSHTPHLGYVDAAAGTSRSKAGSPVRPNPDGAKSTRSKAGSAAPAQARRATSAPQPPKYCDVAVQTDPEDPPTISDAVPMKRRVASCVSLRKRMLENWHHLRVEEEIRIKRRASEQTPSVSAESNADQESLTASPTAVKTSNKGTTTAAAQVASAKDVVMIDTSALALSVVATPNPLKTKGTELRVQMPPPVPAFDSPTSAVASTPAPVFGGPTVPPSPFSTIAAGGYANAFPPPAVNGVTATPSPVKKKLSLSDYKSRIKARPSLGTNAVKPPTNPEEPKSATSVDAGGSPTAEKVASASTPTAVSAAADANSLSAASGPV